MHNYDYHSWVWTPLLIGLWGLGAVLSIIVIAAVLALKGYSLWYAARRGEVGWFIALLIVNTFGILELVYLYFIVKKWHKNVKPGEPKEPHTTTV